MRPRRSGDLQASRDFSRRAVRRRSLLEGAPLRSFQRTGSRCEEGATGKVVKRIVGNYPLRNIQAPPLAAVSERRTNASQSSCTAALRDDERSSARHCPDLRWPCSDPARGAVPCTRVEREHATTSMRSDARGPADPPSPRTQFARKGTAPRAPGASASSWRACDLRRNEPRAE